MILKCDRKFEGKQICFFKSDNNLVNFDPITQSLHSFHANYITFDLKKYRGVLFYDNKESCKICRKTELWLGK